jgi:hypothetical protein
MLSKKLLRRRLVLRLTLGALLGLAAVGAGIAIGLRISAPRPQVMPKEVVASKRPAGGEMIE